MPRKRHTAEQIIGKLREAEVGLLGGQTVPEVLGVAEQTYYLWRKEYGGLKVEQARRFKKLERENLRLRRAVADLTLDKLSMDLYGRVSLLRARRVARGILPWSTGTSPQPPSGLFLLRQGGPFLLRR